LNVLERTSREAKARHASSFRQAAWKEALIMSERILGRHTAELDEQGTLTLYGPGTRMALPYDEAYALLIWLNENHRDTLYQLVHEDQRAEEPLTNTSSEGIIAVPEEGQGDDYAF
jgi:hypothetical protein